MSKRQSRDPGTDPNPCEVCVPPLWLETHSLTQTLALSVPPLALGRGAGENTEGLTSASPPLQPFLASLALCWRRHSPRVQRADTEVKFSLKWGIYWMMTSAGDVFTHWGQTPSNVALSLRIPGHTGRRRMTAFAQAGTAYRCLLLHLWTQFKLYFAFRLPDSPISLWSLISLLWLLIYSSVRREWWVECDCL